MKKRCWICKKKKSLYEFTKNSYRKDGLQSQCKDCAHKKFKLYYKKNRKKQLREVKKRKRKAILLDRQKIIEYLLKHPCVDCREKDIVVLDFDHQGNKKENVTRLVSGGYAWKTIKAEIDKCVVRCANCHRKRTARNNGSYRNIYKLKIEGS